MSLSFHHHQTQLLDSSFSSVGFPAPWVPIPRVLLASLPPREVCVCSNPQLSLCPTFAALMLLLSRNFCVLVLPAGLEISSWQTLPVLALGLHCQAPQGFCTSQTPQTVQWQADREAGSCLNPGILMLAKLGSTSPAHPIHQLPKMNGPCSVRARRAQPGLCLSWQKSIPRAVCEDFGARGRCRGSRTEEEIIWRDPGGISPPPRDQRGPTKPRKAIKKKSIWTTPFS